ncbi:MAG: ABC transporter substrate-binding protein [Clostridia bacterium]|nr:ABC transporter substrate-binding protein [Clostridia bacterium]
MKFRKVVSAALAAAMLMTGAACADTINIAVQGPLTGAAAVYGNAVVNGAKLGADYVNAIDPDYQVNIIPEDDEHDAEKAINAYNAALDAGAQMMLGTTTTTPCIAVSAQAYEDRVFMLTPSASSPAVTEGKDNMYQVCFTDPNQGLASAQYIVDNALATKVAVIYNNADSYSTGIYQTFVDKAAELGLEVVAVSTFTDDTTDFSVQVNAAKDAGADLVFLPIYYTPASQILVYAKGIEYAPVFFGVDGMDGILTMEGFDTSLAEGVMLLTPFSADAEDELTKLFVSQYEAQFGEVPNQFAADAFDGVIALYTASKNAGITGETSPEDACEMLIAQFPSLSVSGLTGDMTWSADGTVNKTPTAVIIKDGAYVGYTK